MRLSTEDGDVGQYEYAKVFNKKITIKLDGEVISCAITADSDLGYVKKYKTFNLAPCRTADGEDYQTEECYGKVKIIIDG